jgi:hypothetical protein
MISGLYDGTYVVEASLDGYAFDPPTRTVTVNGAVVTGQDFTSRPGIAIAGTVTGAGTEAVTISLVGPEPLRSTRTTTTDVGGNYRFWNIDPGRYLVVPSLAGGWTFTPANTLVTVAGTSLSGPNFTATAPTHALGGRIVGALAAGVTITLSGDASGVFVTDGTGNYAFTGLAPGSYVLTPSSPGYSFTPAQYTVAMGLADRTGFNFTSTATHRIAGRISGDVLEGVTVTLSGPSTGTASTDASGYFEFGDLVDGNYTVTPSRDGYTFGPAARTLAVLGANVTTSFTATAAPLPTYAISGSVSGAVQAGVTITLEGPTTAVVTTGAAGTFTFAGLDPGTYLLVASHDDYTFSPASRRVVVSAADVTGQTFTATLDPTARTVSGTVSGATTAGVTITLVGPSPAITSRTATTDATGGFAFRSLADGLYLATPSLAGFVFTPADCLVSVNGPSVTFVEFTAVRAPHAISGAISGPTIAGILLTLTDPAGAASTTSGVDGRYTFPGLADGAYTVTPSLPGYYFSPVEASVTLDGANVTSVDFVIAPSHVISGYVTGDVSDGVKVTLSGAAAAETTTDVTGFYQFTELRDGGYVLTPSLDGYLFNPQLLPIALAGADVTTASFVSTLIPTYAVTGTISGAIAAGVSVQLSSATGTVTTATDGLGVYRFTGLTNGSYMVIPSLSGYSFTAASRAFRIDGADVTGQDFTSATVP